MSEIKANIDNEDWLSKLNDDEVFNGPEGPAPRLRGLRRLARPFLKREESRVTHLVSIPKEVVRKVNTYNGAGDIISSQEQIGHYYFPMASVTYIIEDVNGRTFSDSADAFYSNCNELGTYPTAVASARAEARALRKLLNIAQHSEEELSSKDSGEELAPDDNLPAKPEQVKLIEKGISEIDGFSFKELVSSISAREIFNPSDLTVSEARSALRLISTKKKKKASKK